MIYHLSIVALIIKPLLNGIGWHNFVIHANPEVGGTGPFLV